MSRRDLRKRSRERVRVDPRTRELIDQILAGQVNKAHPITKAAQLVRYLVFREAERQGILDPRSVGVPTSPKIDSAAATPLPAPASRPAERSAAGGTAARQGSVPPETVGRIMSRIAGR